MTQLLQPAKTLLKYPFAALFIGSGIGHFTNSRMYLRIMPPVLPFHREIVAVTGVIEGVLGTLLLFPRTQQWAAWALIPTLIAIFPANIYTAITATTHNKAMPNVPTALAWLRLPVQPLLIAWAWWYTKK